MRILHDPICRTDTAHDNFNSNPQMYKTLFNNDIINTSQLECILEHVTIAECLWTNTGLCAQFLASIWWNGMNFDSYLQTTINTKVYTVFKICKHNYKLESVCKDAKTAAWMLQSFKVFLKAKIVLWDCMLHDWHLFDEMGQNFWCIVSKQPSTWR